MAEAYRTKPHWQGREALPNNARAQRRGSCVRVDRAIAAVPVEERRGIFAHLDIFDHSDEDAVGAELVMIDATAQDRCLGVDEARGEMVVELPSGREPL